jgi:hypothetical protein
MALSEKHRSSIYQGLLQFLGEEEAQALLSQFPARDLDEPVTKEFVRAEISDVRSQLRAEIADVRTEAAEFRGEVRAEFAVVHGEFAAVRGEIAQLEGRMNERFREMTMWVAGALIAGLGASAGIGAGIAALAG